LSLAPYGIRATRSDRARSLTDILTAVGTGDEAGGLCTLLGRIDEPAKDRLDCGVSRLPRLTAQTVDADRGRRGLNCLRPVPDQ
jgi:hypothetical protein